MASVRQRHSESDVHFDSQNECPRAGARGYHMTSLRDGIAFAHRDCVRGPIWHVALLEANHHPAFGHLLPGREKGRECHVIRQIRSSRSLPPNSRSSP